MSAVTGMRWLIVATAGLIACTGQPVDSKDPDGDGKQDGERGCFEAEELERRGEVRVFPGAAETKGGTIVMARDGGGSVVLPITLDQPGQVRIWARVRAAMAGNNSLSVGLDALDSSEAGIWDVPVSPVLRFHRIERRGAAGTFYRADEPDWPGMLAAGTHTIVIGGRESDVELDAICVALDDTPPTERFPEPPARMATHDARQLGAVGDGVVDDGPALQGAIKSLKPGDALHLPAGRYRITAPLIIATSGVSLIGDGPTTVVFSDLPATATTYALAIAGSGFRDATPLLADAPAMSRVIAVSSAAPYQIGDTVQVSCDDWGPKAPNLTTLFHRNRANFAHVVATEMVDGQLRLTLDRPLLSPFLLAHKARVERFIPARDVVISKLAVEGTRRATATDNGDSRLIFTNRCDRCFIVDVELRNMRRSGLDVGFSLDVQAIRVHAHDATDTSEGGHGYGVSSNRSQGLVLRNSKFDGILRHGIVIDWGSREAFVYDNSFDRTKTHVNNIGSIDIHGEDAYCNLVEANKIVGGNPGIIVGGGGMSHGNDGPWNVVRDNHITDAAGGVRVFKDTYDTVIEGNTIIGAKTEGVLVDSGSDRALVWRNTIEKWGTAGVKIVNSDATQVRLNTFVPGTGPGVAVTGATGYVIRENKLGGSKIAEPGSGDVGGNL